MCVIFELDRMSTSKLCFLENAPKRQKNMEFFLPAVSGGSIPGIEQQKARGFEWLMAPR
jgi:hypothetical protein